MTRGIAEKAAGSLGSQLLAVESVSGGDINVSYRLTLDGAQAQVFLKCLPEAPPRFFDAEAEGLALLGSIEGVDVPQTLAVGSDYLALEYLEPTTRSSDYDAELGRMIARLHLSERQHQPADGFIGTLPQSNQARNSWPDFFAQERLLPLVRRSVDQGLLDRGEATHFDSLCKKLHDLIPKASRSVLHGDLWGGNVHVRDGQPCLIDPAAYLGHHEVDLGMMKLFGGFHEDTFAAHRELIPVAPGLDERLALYQLYPLLVHLLLFGTSYLSQVLNRLNRF